MFVDTVTTMTAFPKPRFVQKRESHSPAHFTYHEVIAEFVDPDGESVRWPRLCRPITVNVRRDATQLTVPVHHLDTLKQYNIN